MKKLWHECDGSTRTRHVSQCCPHANDHLCVTNPSKFGHIHRLPSYQCKHSPMIPNQMSCCPSNTMILYMLPASTTPLILPMLPCPHDTIPKEQLYPLTTSLSRLTSSSTLILYPNDTIPPHIPPPSHHVIIPSMLPSILCYTTPHPRHQGIHSNTSPNNFNSKKIDESKNFPSRRRLLHQKTFPKNKLKALTVICNISANGNEWMVSNRICWRAITTTNIKPQQHLNYHNS